MNLNTSNGLHGTIKVPGDKSISHRSIMFSAISKGDAKITGFLRGADCISTINCFKALGIDINMTDSEVIVRGKGLHGLSAPSSKLDAGNSGTTTRLISGILAGQSFSSTIIGDDSLSSRPMGRVITPLSLMGASFDSNNQCLPMTIHGGNLKAIDYTSPVASAQVKSSILLAGLYADGITSVTEPALSRNHTELMLKGLGAEITSKPANDPANPEAYTAYITPGNELFAQDVEVPGDISSATYFIVAGLITPNSEILIENVNINETRAGIIKVALNMGGNLELLNKRLVSGEEVCDVLVKSSNLHGTIIDKPYIPTLIDEIPAIAVMASQANGQTIIKDAAELKVKESNRIDTVVNGLKAMGADIEATDDGMIINGPCKLHGAKIETKLDHRIAMSFAIASLIADGDTELDDYDCVKISYPNFYEDIESLCK